MQVAEAGNSVSVHYTGKLEDGKVFDSSIGRAPLSFVLGSGQMIVGFDKGIAGMEVGEKKEIILPPEEAYGERRDEYIQEIEKNVFQGLNDLHVGKEVVLKDHQNREYAGVVSAINDEIVVVDFNHPLAGKILTFEVELVSVR